MIWRTWRMRSRGCVWAGVGGFEWARTAVVGVVVRVRVGVGCSSGSRRERVRDVSGRCGHCDWGSARLWWRSRSWSGVWVVRVCVERGVGDEGPLDGVDGR